MMTHDELIAEALASQVPALGNEHRGYPAMSLERASSMQFLALEYRKHPENTEIRTALVERIRVLISGGKEPYFNLGLNWHYPMIVNTIALLKDTELWSDFTTLEIEKIDCLMKGFAYILHYACDKDNNYETGLRRNTHWGKHWAPNSHANLLLYAKTICHYFGGREAFAKLFIEFDYDAYIADLTRFNFTNALSTFTTPAIDTEYGFRVPSAREILEGTATDQYFVATQGESTNYLYGGTGHGIKREFLYSQKKPTPANEYGIVRGVIPQLYKNICTSSIEFSGGIAKIADDTISPEEGKKGMFYELNQNWRSGRSCIYHAMINFAIVVSCVITMKELGIMDIVNRPTLAGLYELIKTGNNDLIYKLEHGYHSYNDGPNGIIHESNYSGYYFWKDVWQNELSK